MPSTVVYDKSKKEDMNCPRCGKELPEGAKFCLECGSNISDISHESGAEESLGGFKTVVNTGESGKSSPSSGDMSLGDLNTMVNSASSQSGRLPMQELSERYELGEEIGRGGFATVYKAVDKKLNRTVAIKKLHPGKSDETTVARFRREALSIANLNHKNIVQVYDVGEDSSTGQLFLVMEFVERGTLKDFLKEKGKLTLKEALPLFKGIAQGLSYSHRKNLVHRDIKPANILLTDSLEPKIVDFGLAQAGRDSELSMSGYGMGTAVYMPPEQRRDAKSVNHTADIYALGKVLYEMFTGEMPDNIDPSEIPPPPQLADIIFKCTKPKPEDRFFSVDDILKALTEMDSKKSESNVSSEMNGCPNCGNVNSKDVRFCEKCGAGLFRNCPECDSEISILREFCGSCGTNIQNFLLAEEVLSKMNQYVSEDKWSRVIKEYELFDSGSGLTGEKGQAIKNSIEAVYSETNEKIQYLEKLKSYYADINKAYIDEDWQKVISYISAIDLECSYIGGEADKRLIRRGRFLLMPCSYIGGEADKLIKSINSIFESAVDSIMEDVSEAEATFNWNEVINLLEGVMNVSFVRIPDKVEKTYSSAVENLEKIKELEQKILNDSKNLASGAFQNWDGVSLCDNLFDNIASLEQITHIPEQLVRFKEQLKDKKKSILLKISIYKKRGIIIFAALAALFLSVWLISYYSIKKSRTEKYVNYVESKLILANTFIEEENYQKVVATLYNISTDSGLSGDSSFRLTAEKNALLEEANEFLKPSLGETWIAELGNGVTMELLPVAAGSFMMGSNDSDAGSDEKPVHKVTLTKPFWIGKYEVTQKQYEVVMGKNPSIFKGSNRPVEKVSWNDAMEFCRKLTEKEHASGRLLTGYRYTLPTEAQWEFAARGGENSKGYKYSGSDNLDSVGWYDNNSRNKTHPVGQKAPNELGLYDMSGNVWEWCSDWYGDYTSDSFGDPVGPISGTFRVFRGGNWLNYSVLCRLADRCGDSPSSSFSTLGFRLCLQTTSKGEKFLKK